MIKFQKINNIVKFKQMKNNIVIACIIVVLVIFCNTKTYGIPSYPEGTITLKGNVMCNTAVEGEVFIKERLPEEHELVFFCYYRYKRD